MLPLQPPGLGLSLRRGYRVMWNRVLKEGGCAEIDVLLQDIEDVAEEDVAGPMNAGSSELKCRLKGSMNN